MASCSSYPSTLLLYLPSVIHPQIRCYIRGKISFLVSHVNWVHVTDYTNYTKLLYSFVTYCGGVLESLIIVK